MLALHPARRILRSTDNNNTTMHQHQPHKTNHQIEHRTSNIEQQQQHPQNCQPCLLMTQTNRLKQHSPNRRHQTEDPNRPQRCITSSYLVADFAGPIEYRQPHLRPFRPHNPFAVLDQHCVYPLLLRLGQRTLEITGRQPLRT